MPKRGILRFKIDLACNLKYINMIEGLSKARKPGRTRSVVASSFSFDYFSGIGGSGLTKCQSGVRSGAAEVRNARNTKNTRNSRICAHLPSWGEVQAVAEFPCVAIPRRHFPRILFTEIYRKPREFIGIYRYFRILFFAFFGFCASPERPTCSCGRHQKTPGAHPGKLNDGLGGRPRARAFTARGIKGRGTPPPQWRRDARKVEF